MISLTTLFLGSLVWADNNGVWHEAGDIKPGIFGEDEAGPGDFYQFGNKVIFGDGIVVNKIESNSGGNVVIQLG